MIFLESAKLVVVHFICQLKTAGAENADLRREKKKKERKKERIEQDHGMKRCCYFFLINASSR